MMNKNTKHKQASEKRGLKIIGLMLIAIMLVVIGMDFVSAVTNVSDCSTQKINQKDLNNTINYGLITIN